MMKVRCNHNAKPLWKEKPTAPAEPVFEVDVNAILRRLKPNTEEKVRCRFCNNTALVVRRDWRGDPVVKPTKGHCKDKPKKTREEE